MRKGSTYVEAWSLRQGFVMPEPNTGCHIWIGGSHPKGYGCTSFIGRPLSAHRMAYMARHGSIGEGLQIDHLCKNPSCVNVDHLEAVPCEVNNSRSNSPTALNARKTSCIHGHEYTPETLIVSPEGWRRCRICESVRARKYRTKRNARKFSLGRALAQEAGDATK